MAEQQEGGCQCGAVRYRLEGQPLALAVCHCRECQRQSGSAFGMSLIVPKESFRLLSGQPKTFSRAADSGGEVVCSFCADCGTRICHAPSKLTATVNVKPGTLDDTSWLEPGLHTWTKRKQPWVQIPKDVRCFEEQP
jgi:hypothetical protein